MADFSELPLGMRMQLALYPWRRIDPVPWTPMRVPLASARVALVTSAGMYRVGIDAPFAPVRGGDSSYRLIPDDTATQDLVVGQVSHAFDRGPAERDPNIAFPLDRLHEMVADGTIGHAAPRHVSINGSITAPGRLVRDTAPRIAAELRDDGVDVALLVPI
ncbi:MAG TPA: glycine/sarcosine/betaine reductase selenoprotein B family protein [Gemmatimonadaceae bacterium]|nr:glycine/sarcosine/betaine reductase selenoprotein B family protein [Gemmatimonadaceae bacterium]